jgi:Raf kinase inhibitor-like YbhB/YbcL family protein
MAIEIKSDRFSPDGPIPTRFTADGANVSPPITWSGLPKGTKELALIVEDPDAPRAEPFVHWVVYRIPSEAPGLPDALPPQSNLSTPNGAVQGVNSFGEIGYGGPAPPRGHGTHHYHFRLYALDARLNVEGGLDNKSLNVAMSGHVLGQADLVGTYAR